MVDQLYSQIVWNVFRNNEFYRLRMKCDFVHFWGLTASNRLKRIFLPRSRGGVNTGHSAIGSYRATAANALAMTRYPAFVGWTSKGSAPWRSTSSRPFLPLNA
jgi:hypothetical protein